MNIVTREFIERQICGGALAQAKSRAFNGTALPRSDAKLSDTSTWELICEEILDTEHSNDWYDSVLAELLRRGLSPDRIDEMRRFAWKTAGWLNVDQALWEWVALDERDIKLALEWQIKDGIIDQSQYDEGLRFLEAPGGTSSAL